MYNQNANFLPSRFKQMADSLYPYSDFCVMFHLHVVILLYVQLIHMINRLALREANLSRIFMVRRDGWCSISVLYSGYLGFKTLLKFMSDCHHLPSSSQDL